MPSRPYGSERGISGNFLPHLPRKNICEGHLCGQSASAEMKNGTRHLVIASIARSLLLGLIKHAKEKKTHLGSNRVIHDALCIGYAKSHPEGGFCVEEGCPLAEGVSGR
jgi:hypothetical protein